MKKGNLIVACVLEGLGIWVIFDSYRMGLQTLANPGAGLFPFLLGILLSLSSLPICISSIKDLRKANGARKEEEGIRHDADLRKLGGATLCFIGYFLLLDTLGFLLTSFIFLFGLFLIGNPRKWAFNSIFSASVVVLAYMIFNIFLQVPFPSGIFR
jgi:hypothetical protein